MRVAKIGDEVQLLGKLGPRMTVHRVIDRQTVECVWFAQDGLRTGRFRSDFLVIVSRPWWRLYRVIAGFYGVIGMAVLVSDLAGNWWLGLLNLAIALYCLASNGEFS